MSWTGFDETFLDQMRATGRLVEDVMDGRTVGDVAPERTNGSKRKPRQREHEMQQAFVDLCAYKEVEYPELAMLFAIPNGGDRHSAVAAKLKAEGARAGIPDIFLAAPAGEYHGLFLELKVSGGRVRATQERWINALARQGYATRVAWSLDEAWHIIEQYLNEEL